MQLNDLRKPKRTPSLGTRGTPEWRERAEIARRFYCDILGGRQVWQGARRAAPDVLWFRVGGSLIEVTTSRPLPVGAIEITVESPLDLAAQCWDAGSTVHLHTEGGDDTVTVTDPFGRAITLVQRAADRRAREGTEDDADRLHLIDVSA
jgi:catechol 2,3-dioxygenase-like lactoylglutathione lyase family enzyme